MNCICKLCKAMFYTEAPSRVTEPLCASCILKEKVKPKFIGMHKDHEKVRNQLRKEFGVCPSGHCINPLIPLQSFKINGKMHCEGCYSKLIK